MQKKYFENYLKSYAVKSSLSKGRVFYEEEDVLRNIYQRDSFFTAVAISDSEVPFCVAKKIRVSVSDYGLY